MINIPITIPAMEIAIPTIALLAVQLLKKLNLFQGGRAKELLPLWAALIAAPIAVVYQLLFGDFIFESEYIAQLVIYGFSLGLTACGAFSLCKGLFMGKNPKQTAQDRGKLL